MFINSIGGLSLMVVLFLVQLKYSKRFRAYSKNLLHLLLFISTLVGLGGSSFLIYYSVFRKRRRAIKDGSKKGSKSESDKE